MNTKTTPKDFFLHLGATIALYAAATALINLSLSIIDYLQPDALAGSFYASSIAWPVSMLLILVPILYILEWTISRDIARMPEKRDIWIRKWRIYLTLFLAIVLVGGDLIALVNTYLSGEITARFAWKVLLILLVAGAIGKYYFFSVVDTYKHAKLFRRGNAWFGIVLVVVAIESGFIIVGSPAKQRALRFDDERVSDLSNIQWQLISYWQTTGGLPAALDKLADPVSGVTIAKAPQTSAAYGYSMTGKTAFKLCATFDLASVDGTGRGIVTSYPGGVADNWAHRAGNACFDRTIDPARYPVISERCRQIA